MKLPRPTRPLAHGYCVTLKHHMPSPGPSYVPDKRLSELPKPSRPLPHAESRVTHEHLPEPSCVAELRLLKLPKL